MIDAIAGPGWPDSDLCSATLPLHRVRPLQCFAPAAAGYELRHTTSGFTPDIEKRLMVHELATGGAQP